MPLTPEHAAALAAAIDAHRHEPGALLPILHAVQDAIGYVPTDAVAPIAESLNLSRAEVHGVITFYHHFRQQPPGRHVLQVCRAEACQAAGGRELAAHAEQAARCKFDQVRADGHLSLETVYCLGHCAAAPAVMVDHLPYARVTPDRLDALLRELEGV